SGVLGRCRGDRELVARRAAPLNHDPAPRCGILQGRVVQICGCMERILYSSTWRFLLAGALLACAATTVVGIQDGQQPAPIFKTKINLVRVDVSVTGRHDEPVADLQAGDFDVVEDGVLQRVETLQFVRLDGSRTTDLEDSLEIRSPEHAALEAARDDVR